MSSPTNPSTTTLPTRSGYDAWSHVYDHDLNPLVLLEERHVGSILADPPPRGLDIADIGCGTGRHAVRLAAAGANVTALDFSDGMLAQARTKLAAAAESDDSITRRLRLIQHDITKPLPLPARAFDRVLCCLVLDHIADIAGLFTELARICKPPPPPPSPSAFAPCAPFAQCAPFILLTVMHPAMLLRGVQARFIDPATGARTQLDSVPNQISDYVSGAVRAGLTIDHISEHAADEALAAQTSRAEKHLGWPLLLVMKLKPPSAR